MSDKIQLSETAVALLTALMDHGPTTRDDLADLLDVRIQSIRGVVQSLSKKDLTEVDATGKVVITDLGIEMLTEQQHDEQAAAAAVTVHEQETKPHQQQEETAEEAPVVTDNDVPVVKEVKERAVFADPELVSVAAVDQASSAGRGARRQAVYAICVRLGPNASRKEVIAAIMSEVGMTAAGANTYQSNFYSKNGVWRIDWAALGYTV